MAAFLRKRDRLVGGIAPVGAPRRNPRSRDRRPSHFAGEARGQGALIGMT